MSEKEIVCEDLARAIDDLRGQGFRLDVIYPADDPQAAILSRGQETLRLTLGGVPAPVDELFPFEPEFVLTRVGVTPGRGRAGMLYRDLIPGRLGGRYIASHITISNGGPVADWVHYHRVRLQMIYVRRGWVRVVYEDQGDPFLMNEGDLVLQPPEIRHRVLESSPGLEVIEISAPALHETVADHDLVLPGGKNSHRLFRGQHFLRHVAEEASWSPFNGAEAQETAMRQATGHIAEVRTIRPGSSPEIAFSPHAGELVFGFLLEGAARLHFEDEYEIGPADAFVIPPGKAWRLSHMNKSFRLLHVTTARLDAAA